MATLPADTPVTMPALFTVAMVVLALLHTPPLPVVLRVPVAPTHTVEGPPMVPASGNGFTVTVAVAATVPQVPVTE